MRVGIFLAASLWALDCGLAANRQPRDLFSFSTHKYPAQAVSNSKNAFVLTEGGILVYDYGRGAWIDNLAAGMRVQGIRWSQTRARLYALIDGRPMEYNEAFRRFTDASEEDFNSADGVGEAAALEGLVMEGDELFLGNAVR